MSEFYCVPRDPHAGEQRVTQTYVSDTYFVITRDLQMVDVDVWQLLCDGPWCGDQPPLSGPGGMLV